MAQISHNIRYNTNENDLNEKFLKTWWWSSSIYLNEDGNIKQRRSKMLIIESFNFSLILI